MRSMSEWRAVVSSQTSGFCGTPSRGQAVRAATNDMTALTNGGIPISLYNDMDGFSFQNNQYVFYVAR
jgi:hypothetical protein